MAPDRGSEDPVGPDAAADQLLRACPPGPRPGCRRPPARRPSVVAPAQRGPPVGAPPLRPPPAEALPTTWRSPFRRRGAGVLTVRPGAAAGTARSRDCWRSRHALRPARSWRTAQTMTSTASTTMATTKIPKIAKKATSVAGAGGTRAGCHAPCQGMSHPVGTLHRWSSSHHARCSGLRTSRSRPAERSSGREVLALLRGDTAARPRFDPGLAGGLRAWLEDAAYDVGRHPGRARPAGLPRAEPAARLARRMAGRRRAVRRAGPLAPRARAVPPARHRGKVRPPAARRARRAARVGGRGAGAARSSRWPPRRGPPCPRRWRRMRPT